MVCISQFYLESVFLLTRQSDLICTDIPQILAEAQHRWLRPAEIYEILHNYQKFKIAPEPPNRPSSMILEDITKVKNN